MRYFGRVVTRLIPEDDFVSLQSYGVLSYYELYDKVYIYINMTI
jgi:hypothetical protein